LVELPSEPLFALLCLDLQLHNLLAIYQLIFLFYCFQFILRFHSRRSPVIHVLLAFILLFLLEIVPRHVQIHLVITGPNIAKLLTELSVRLRLWFLHFLTLVSIDQLISIAIQDRYINAPNITSFHNLTCFIDLHNIYINLFIDLIDNITSLIVVSNFTSFIDFGKFGCIIVPIQISWFVLTLLSERFCFPKNIRDGHIILFK